MLISKISVPSTITVQKAYLFKPSMIELPIEVIVTPHDLLGAFDKICINVEVNEINIIFISDFEDMTFSHYMVQPKSTLCRKLVINSIDEDFGDFDYNWFPNCFRHINT